LHEETSEWILGEIVAVAVAVAVLRALGCAVTTTLLAPLLARAQKK
jgi:hypothetical protein